jgi:hypothetical protein
MLFNQQQCFIYSTASFLSKLRAKKVEKLRLIISAIPNLEITSPGHRASGFFNPCDWMKNMVARGNSFTQ